MNQSTLCLGDAEVERLLSSELTSERTSELERHLTDCLDCREKLEHQVGDDGWWCYAQSSLRTGLRWARSGGNDEDSPERLLELLGPTDDPNLLGRIGSYEIIGLLGQGGMGAVFKGFDRSLNRFVAVKILLPHLAASGAARKRFEREGQAAAAVIDDHVMPIYTVAQWRTVPYLVMKYSTGSNLQKRLDHDGPFDAKEILRIGMQTSCGLAAAHSQGLVHRDVKPSNVLLDGTVERVMLTDFGLARAVDDASITRTGTIAGTPQYMSPEQVRGEAIDARSDLFGLGCVLYALSTGHPPFRAETSYAVLRRITDDEPRPIRESNPDVPLWLEKIVMKLLAKSPDDRFESVEGVAMLLEDCLAHVQQPTTTPLPEAAAGLLSNRSGHPPTAKRLGAAAFAFSLFLAGIFLVLELNNGALTIKYDTNDVPILKMQGEKLVQQTTQSQYNELIRQQRYAEAEVVLRNAQRLNPATQSQYDELTQQKRFAEADVVLRNAQ